MTIRRGEPWGEVRAVPDDVRIVDDDLALHHWVVRHRSAGQAITDVGVRRGDLARTCGGGPPGRLDGEALYAPVDILRITADPGSAYERVTWAVSHLVARRCWWRGEVLLAMNAEFYGAFDVAPRAHPNDGRADLVRVSGDMPWRSRRAARRRAVTGTHLPHPQLASRQAATFEEQFTRPLVLWVDGERWGTASRIRIDVEPDALAVYL